MFIDSTYFILNKTIPESSSVDIGTNLNTTEVFIDKYVPILLNDCLGSVLFNDLKENTTGNQLKEDASEKWVNLVNGKVYNNKVWRGLKAKENDVYKHSILTGFVFYHWLRDNLTEISGFGEVKGSAVNSLNVNSTHRSIEVWNEFVKEYQGEGILKSVKTSIVNGTPFFDYYQGNNSGNATLLEFLQDHSEDYPNAPLKKYQFKNYLGL